MNRYKKTSTSSLFSETYRPEKISKQGDPLERLNKVINWDYFRETIDKMYSQKIVNAGPKPYDPLLMFKILILQRYYNLSDAQIEYQILDRLSFCRFLGLSLNDKVPDEKTIWDFRDKLIKKGIEKELFTNFNKLLESNDLIAQEGKIIDASFVEAPKQRNSKDKNTQIKQGKGSELWKEDVHKKRQKDIDARWTKKNNQSYYGYKNHTKVDNKHKFIETYTTTDASVHDSQVLDALLTDKDKNQSLWADSAYRGGEQEKTIKKYQMVESPPKSI
ncbi:MAG: IS5 family transposase [Polaribacter sp.]